MDLSESEAEASLDFLLNDANEALIGAFLVLLRAKGETYEEVSLVFKLDIHNIYLLFYFLRLFFLLYLFGYYIEPNISKHQLGRLWDWREP